MFQSKDLSRKSCHGGQCQISWKAIIVHLLRLIQEVSGVKNRMIGLKYSLITIRHATTSSWNACIHLDDNLKSILGQDSRRELRASVRLSLVPWEEKDSLVGKGNRLSARNRNVPCKRREDGNYRGVTYSTSATLVQRAPRWCTPYHRYASRRPELSTPHVHGALLRLGT